MADFFLAPGGRVLFGHGLNKDTGPLFGGGVTSLLEGDLRTKRPLRRHHPPTPQSPATCTPPPRPLLGIPNTRTSRTCGSRPTLPLTPAPLCPGQSVAPSATLGAAGFRPPTLSLTLPGSHVAGPGNRNPPLPRPTHHIFPLRFVARQLEHHNLLKSVGCMSSAVGGWVDGPKGPFSPPRGGGGLLARLHTAPIHRRPRATGNFS